MRTRHVGLSFSAVALSFACAVGAGVLVTEPGAAAVQRTAGRTLGRPPLIIGIADSDLINDSPKVQAAELAKMRSIGINSFRLDADWAWVQFAGPRSFDWTQLDQAIHSIRAAGLTVDLVIDGFPLWAALPSAIHYPHPQPASPTLFAGWAADVARRYTPEGVKYFEIWSEPNDRAYWAPRSYPGFYTKMLADSYLAIKKINPAATVISGGLAPVAKRYDSPPGSENMLGFLSAIYADGAKPFMDGVAIHPYSYPALPDTFETWSAWSQMSLTTVSVRSIMRQYQDATKPIWITEFADHSAPNAIMAKSLKQAMVIARSSTWIRAIYFYTPWPAAVSAIARAIRQTA